MNKHHIACDDVVAGCPFTAEAESEEALLAKVKAHARDAHGVDQLTPELLAKVKEVVRKR